MRKLAIVLGCLLYVVSPIDCIPDPILVAGQIDDLVAIAFTVRSLLKDTEKRGKR
jgi:uncharacterized membrane protein YkvA (DUF1232 family)